MNTLYARFRRGLLAGTITSMILASAPVHADGPYLAMAGANSKIELLNLTDFSPVAAIDVAPMLPWLTFLPQAHRLYATSGNVYSNLKSVLDLGTCSGGLRRPIDIPNPFSIVANGDETKLFVSSSPGATGNPDAVNSVFVIDPSSDTVTGILSPTTTGNNLPGFMVFDAERNELYVSFQTPSVMRVYDATTLAEVRQCAFMAANIIARGKVYDVGGNRVDVHDALTCNSIRSISLPGGTESVVRTRAADKVYVLTSSGYPNPQSLSENTVTVIESFP
jgi:hypothetical protein